MTTSVTIKNQGPGRINVNEIEPDGPAMGGKERTFSFQTLDVGDEVTLNVWGHQHYLTILETNDVDTAHDPRAEALRIARHRRFELKNWPDSDEHKTMNKIIAVLESQP
jgi:hypothetical protein